MVVPELPMEERYYPLHLFGRGAKLRQVLVTLKMQGDFELLSYGILMHPQILWR